MGEDLQPLNESFGMADAVAAAVAEDEAEQDRPNQTEWLLGQMRKCVLVHHQLSCLLIHHAALDAGLAPGGDGDACVSDGSAALQQSIRSHGGSTARLFSMALQDKNDLEAMGETLQQRVDDLIQTVDGDLRSLGLKTEVVQDSSHTFLAPMAHDNPVESTDDLEIQKEELRRECDGLAAQLATQQLTVARLQNELEDARRTTFERQHQLTVDCFDEVQLATQRTMALEEALRKAEADVLLKSRAESCRSAEGTRQGSAHADGQRTR
eukprot:CAMPEP_0170637702 /NCGR_PEP_ID=MMETSP0224-20130122/38575_1 /TAXON_ID=285029 /ORGANISM="Togula jolla, Strain CCCM 725" /LENGTH=266 /DNA_ID=CAMNT_0010967645 /DNA_START=33 /DNA_END=829 /DNA_ORIENTATION=-